MFKKALKTVSSALILIIPLITPFSDARLISLSFIIAPTILAGRPVGAEKCAIVITKSKGLGIGCFVVEYGMQAMTDTVKAVGLRQFSTEIGQIMYETPANVRVPEKSGMER